MRSTVYRKVSSVFSVSAAGLCAIAAGVVPAAQAGNSSTKSAGQVVEVVAKLELSGSPVTNMVLVEKGRKQYLYIGRDAAAGLCIVDVTNARKARLVGRAASAVSPATESKVSFDDTQAMILIAPDRPAAPQNAGPATHAVAILDVRDPSNPAVVRAFQGVTSIATDNVRGLLYVADGDGLWILEAKDNPPAKPALAEEQN